MCVYDVCVLCTCMCLHVHVCRCKGVFATSYMDVRYTPGWSWIIPCLRHIGPQTSGGYSCLHLLSSVGEMKLETYVGLGVLDSVLHICKLFTL